MKKLVLFTLLFGTMFSMKAQIEVKFNPIYSIIGSVDVQSEYLVSETFGVELSLQPFFGHPYSIWDSEFRPGKQSGFAEKLRAKYYFSPYNGGDKKYLDMFVVNSSVNYTQSVSDFKETYIGVGVEYGTKTVFDSGFVYEYAVGLGTYLSHNYKYLDDTSDTDQDMGANNLNAIPVFLSGKLVIGYRFGDF